MLVCIALEFVMNNSSKKWAWIMSMVGMIDMWRDCQTFLLIIKFIYLLIQ